MIKTEKAVHQQQAHWKSDLSVNLKSKQINVYLWKVYNYYTWKLSLTARRKLMCTYQEIYKTVINWNTVPTLAPYSGTVDYPLFCNKRKNRDWKQKEERNTICVVHLTYWKFFFVIFWTANWSCKAKVHIAVNCMMYFAMYAWNQCWIPTNDHSTIHVKQ